jgi:hypothetical protein
VLGTRPFRTDRGRVRDERQGPNELGFTLIQYGVPIVAGAAVVLSFFTARRRGGILVPVLAWLVIIAAFVVLVFSFTPAG